MHEQNNAEHTTLLKNLQCSIEVFSELLSVPENSVPATLRAKALLRRLRISFLGLYEYLRQKSEIAKDMHDKPLEEIADYFIKKECLSSDDKESFLMMGSVYSAIRWSAPGNSPHEERILNEIPKLYDFLQRYSESQKSSE